MKIKDKVWVLPVLLVIFGLVQLCPAQQSKNLAEYEKLNGRIKSVVFQRTYLIYKGKKTTSETQLLGKDLFDAEGRLIQTSVYANGEERTSFNWVGKTYTASVSYFDLAGKPAPKLKASFASSTEHMPENDLCPEFTLKREKDVAAKIEREYEVCSDNSIRKTTTSEFSTDNNVLREFIEDSKGRTRETTYKYGINFALSGFRYTVNNLKKPKYWQEVTYSDTQFDEKKNWISCVASSTNSAHPNEIWYQYIEERKITYYD